MNQHTKSAINRKLIQQILDSDPNLELVVSMYVTGGVASVFLRQKGQQDLTELTFTVEDWYPHVSAYS